MGRSRRRRRTSRPLVLFFITLTAAGVVVTVRKFRAPAASPVNPSQVVVGAKTMVNATPVSNHPQPQARVTTPERPVTSPLIIQQPPIALKPLLQVTETPAAPPRGTAPSPSVSFAPVASAPAITPMPTPAPISAPALAPAPTPIPAAPRTQQPVRVVAALPSTDWAATLNQGERVVRKADPASSADYVALPVSPDKALAVAKERLANGDFLGARRALNDPFVVGALPAADRPAAHALLCEISEQLVFGKKTLVGDDYSVAYSVRAGDLLQSIARAQNVPWELLARINGLSDARRLQAGTTIKLLNGPFHAVVYKKRFTMDLFLGSPGGPGALYVTSFPVGLGMDDSTPTGKWVVEPRKKIRNPVYYSPRGEGVFAADDPKNPLGEYWIALSGLEGDAVGKHSYGIHGTIEPETIGKQASMGCIRLKDGDIDRVFDMLQDGQSLVVVRD